MAFLLREIGEDFSLEHNDRRGGFLARLHARLMIGVHVDQARVKTHRPLKERDEHAHGKRRDLADDERDGFATVLVQRLPRAEQEAREIIPRRHARLHGQRRAVPVPQHLDEGDEEIVQAVAQLLHVGVLVSRTFVAVHGQALVHHLAVEIQLLAQRFHDELLEIFGKQFQPILVGQHHHVLCALAAASVEPHRRQQRRRVAARLGAARRLIAGARAGQHGVDVQPLQRGGQQAHGGKLARPAAHPVPHRETRQPAVLGRELIQLAACARHGHGVFAELQPRAFIRGPRLQHSVTRLLGAARFRDDHAEGAAQIRADFAQHLVHAVRVRVVEEEHAQLVRRRLAQRLRDELRTEGRAADADDQHILKRPLRAANGAVVNLPRELFDRCDGVVDFRAQGGRGREGRMTQPVMPHHALLVRIGEATALQRLHGRVGRLQTWLHLREKIFGEIHPAQVERQPERRVIGEMFLEP